MLEPQVRLRQAIADGNLLVVKRLLKRFPDLLENIDPCNGWSSLHYAAYHGRYLICVHLISLGHDREEVLRTFRKNTCVHLALLNGHEQTTHLLLQHFPKLLNSKGEQGHTPLHVSAIKDHFKCAQMLLGLGADINAVDDEGNNSLHLAMKYGSLRTIKLLVHRNIDTNHKNNIGLRPIDVSSSFQTEKFYNETLNNKSPNEEDEFTTTPIISSQKIFLNDSPGSPKRVHSNSLPPLPSVTTARRPSVTSTSSTTTTTTTATTPGAATTRSPVPRTAISLGFNGLNSSSYVYSPVASQFPASTSTSSSLNGLSLKLPSISTGFAPSSGSPVLYSPIASGTYNGNDSLKEKTSISSFPSMSSLNSDKNNYNNSTSLDHGNRSRAQSTQFISISKTRSNSASKANVSTSTLSSSTSSLGSIKQQQQSGGGGGGGGGKFSPISSTTNLSRSSTRTAKSDNSENIHIHGTSQERSRNNSMSSSTTTKDLMTENNYMASYQDLTKSRTNSITSSTINRSSIENHGGGGGGKILSSFESLDNAELRQKLNEKFDNVTNEYKKEVQLLF